MRISREYKFFGKVQGVGFRFHVKNRAEELGVDGFVQNLNDGSVLVHMQGEEKNLQKLFDFCYNGIQYAQIERAEEVPARNEEARGFAIRRRVV